MSQNICEVELLVPVQVALHCQLHTEHSFTARWLGRETERVSKTRMEYSRCALTRWELLAKG